MLQVVNSFKIGCDPEFMVYGEDGNIVPNLTRMEAENPEMQNNHTDTVGFDMGGIELRPNPAYSVVELLDNIKKALSHPYTKAFRKYTWRAGAWTKNYKTGDLRNVHTPLGGHIHIDIPIRQSPTTGYLETDENKLRIKACDRVVEVLEKFNILPTQECKERREKSSYGNFSSYYLDKQSPEGHRRIEYRTPCSWLFSYKAAYITITGIKLAATNPQFALDTLVGSTPELLWKNFVKFFRAYSAVDVDAREVAKKLIRTSNMSSVRRLQANPAADFKKEWGVPTEEQTNVG